MATAATDCTRPKPKKKPTAPLTLSPAGAAFIARFEGFSAKLYDDPAPGGGNATIGFGHLVHRGPINGHELPEYARGITRARALELLRQDAGAAAAAVRGCVKVKLSQHQFDALVSFTYNCGAGALRTSSLLRRLNAGEHDAVPGELAKWVRANGQVLPGLVTRRNAEGRLFHTGTYA